MTRILTTKTFLILATLLVTLTGLISCAHGKETSRDQAEPTQIVSNESDAPSVSMIEGLDAREALALANRWGKSEKRVTSFVDTKKISFEFQDGGKISVPIPEPKMVVAIAPYMTFTHPCENHYMSGCQGELVNVPVKVYGRTKDGLVVVDKTITTMENGFFELWLTRDLEITLTLEAGGKHSTQTISTGKNSNTCVTTMQLL